MHGSNSEPTANVQRVQWLRMVRRAVFGLGLLLRRVPSPTNRQADDRDDFANSNANTVDNSEPGCYHRQHSG